MTTKPVARVLAVSAAAVLALTACSSNSGPVGPGSIDGAQVAFLMPYAVPTGNDQNDFPGYEKKMNELCPSCLVLDGYAGGDAWVQHQQFTEALIQGAKVIVLDPVDSEIAGGLVKIAKSQGVKVIAYDRPIPTTPADFYVTYDSEKIGALISDSLVGHLKKTGVDPAKGGILEVNGAPTDAEAGLIKKGINSGLASGAYKTLAEYDTPESAPAKAQDWVTGQVARFGPMILGVVAANDGTGGGAIAAFKAAGVNPVPPVTSSDATAAGLQLIISGDQYNTVSGPSEIAAAAAAEASIALLKGDKPKSDTTLFDTPSRLFAPEVITADNIKAQMFDTGIATAAEVCTGAYQAPCTKLGIS